MVESWSGREEGWRRALWGLLGAGVLLFSLFLPLGTGAARAELRGADGVGGEPSAADELFFEDPWESLGPEGDDQWRSIADPFEPLNRVFFTINDRLYFWALKPAANLYAGVVPEELRRTVRLFFRNLTAPVRIVNHLLQGRFRAGGSELARFAINSSMGIAGLTDPAADHFSLEHRSADFGQTLGIYGVGDFFFINWPLLGPSTLRDSLGMVGDSMVNPVSRLTASDPSLGVGVYAGRAINTTSLNMGEYERMIAASLDPYLAIRNAYWQYRRRQILEPERSGDPPAALSDASLSPLSPGGGGNEKENSPLSAEEGSGGSNEMAGVEAVLPRCPGTGYYIHVGAFVDREELLASLNAMGEVGGDACAVVHSRPNYRFYGIMIPAGADFAQAKERERRLEKDGIRGWLVGSFS